MANPGDKVRITTKKEVLEGTLIQKPKLLGDDSIVLKLKNGYNVGIDKKDIKKTEVLEESKESKSNKQKLPSKKGLPTVTIISVGGTISSKVDYKTGGVVADYTGEDFVAMCPELADIANIKAVSVLNVMSENLNPGHWLDIAKAIGIALKDSDGIVVTTGTDTLGYLAAAMSFMVKPDKPVILTASQRSIDRGSSDGFFNLICSVKAAVEWNGTEVVTCMHGVSGDEFCTLIKGTKVRKMSTSRRDAFRPINCTEYAKVYTDKIEIIDDSYKKDQKFGLDIEFDDKVALVFIFPGMKKDSLLQFEKYKGIILMATGFGGIPEDMYPTIKKLVKSGVFVGSTSQCIYGRTSSKVYSPLRQMSIDLGVVFLEDMLPETAFVKLGWLLSQKGDVKERMLENISGEFNERITFDEFLN